MGIRYDKFKVGDKVTWDQNKPSWRSDLPDQLTIVAVENIHPDSYYSAQHTQFVVVEELKPRNRFTGWYFKKVGDNTDLQEVVKVLQQKVDNQKNEIKDLTRKYESAKRVNRGLQKKKDKRGNAIAYLTNAIYDAEADVEFLLAVNKVQEAMLNMYEVVHSQE